MTTQLTFLEAKLCIQGMHCIVQGMLDELAETYNNPVEYRKACYKQEVAEALVERLEQELDRALMAEACKPPEPEQAPDRA